MDREEGTTEERNDGEVETFNALREWYGWVFEAFETREE